MKIENEELTNKLLRFEEHCKYLVGLAKENSDRINDAVIWKRFRCESVHAQVETSGKVSFIGCFVDCSPLANELKDFLCEEYTHIDDLNIPVNFSLEW